jgi:Kef-type K+ transport system membrane component KefB
LIEAFIVPAVCTAVGHLQLGVRFSAVAATMVQLDSGAHVSDPVVPVLLTLVVLISGAALGGRLMTWMKQPAVLGELLVGVAVGNLAYFFGSPAMTVLREGETLRQIADLALSTSLNMSQAAQKLLPASEHSTRIAEILAGPQGIEYLRVYSFVDMVSRIAILILLFLIGLETSIGEMKRVGTSAIRVALIGVIVPLGLGMGTMKLLHPQSVLTRDLFIGGILTATSVGITARVLRDLGQETRDEARVILGAAVLDDVLSLIVLAVVSALAVSGRINFGDISRITVGAAAFLGGSFWIGIWITPKLWRFLQPAGTHNLKLVFGLIFALFLAWLASLAGLSTIVGAFAAGMILNHVSDKEVQGLSLGELLSPVESLVVPLFFVWMGIQVKLETLLSRDVLLVASALTVVAIVGKLVSGLGCQRGMNRLAVGFGMIPRGEVGLIFAGIGKTLGVVDAGLFSAVVILVMITTLLAPLALRWTLLENQAPGELAGVRRNSGPS